jgi:SAM-dependent methyltransferase
MNYTTDAYRSTPLAVEDGIPMFSHVDAYVENYQRIASDHVAAMAPGHANPFMQEALWLALEDSTRRLIVKHVPEGGRILDVGVGLGRVITPLTQYQRFGIDISMDYLGRTRHAGIEVSFSRIEDMPFRDGYFDAVVVCDVLEHVIDLDFCCRQILRVLRPGGTLIVRVPYREDLSAYVSPDLPYEFVHLRSFDEFSLQLLFEKVHRCQVIELQEVAPYLQGPPRMKLRQLPLGSPLIEFLRQVRPGEKPPALAELSVPAAQPDPDQTSTPVEAADAGPSLVQQTGFVHCVARWVRRKLGAQGSSPLVAHVATTPEVPVAPAAAAQEMDTPVPTEPHPLALLVDAMRVNQDEFTNWIYKLRDEHPDWYEFIIPHIAYGMEINAVVRKPAAADHPA